MKNIFRKLFSATGKADQTSASNSIKKECAECKFVKPTADFHKNKNSKDGLQSLCKQCRKIEFARWYEDNKNGRKSTKRKSKRPSFLKKTTLQGSYSNYNIKRVPVELKIALHKVAKERKTTMGKLGLEMIRDFLILNNK